jgi:peptide/nickel transport system substrate-binding protein
MKKIFSLIAIVSMMVMVIPLIAPMANAAQPPINTSTFWEGTIGWGPVDADPAIAYDTASGQLIFNVYEGLIAMNGSSYWESVPALATNVPTRSDVRVTVTNTSAVGEDPTGSTWSGGNRIFGWIDELGDGLGATDAIYMTDGAQWHTWQIESITGTSTITLNLWRGSYVFNLVPAGTIPFYDHTGAVQDTFDVKDAEYSFEKALVLDPPGQPIWMYDKPFFDLSDHTFFTNDTAMDFAHLIDDCIVGNVAANTLTMNVGVKFPDNALKQILEQTWGAIVSKEFSLQLGCWNGDLFAPCPDNAAVPLWWIEWAAEGGGIDYATLDPQDQMVPEVFCGTGPYYVDTISSVDLKVILKRNVGYYKGWPQTEFGVSSGYIDTYEIDYIAAWTTRKAAFLAGDIDVCAVPRAYMFELLDNTTKEPPAGTASVYKTIKNIVPALSMDSNMFQFNIRNDSTYVGSGHFPDGIPLNFFNNTHCRKAFGYSFNWSTFSEQAYFGESDYRKNSLVLGLYPDYYNDSAAPGYFESFANAEAELKAAIFSGTSVWASGFTLDVTFNTGNDVRKIADNLMAAFFQTLSTYDGRTGPPFVVNVKEIDWTTTIRGMTRRLQPLFSIGWLADFADADNFVRTYMHSFGAFCYYQSYSASNGWGTEKDILVDTAVLTPDGPARQALYDQLAVMYYDDVPSTPINTPRGRRWCQYWVKGWYYDALYPAYYIRNYWKTDDCWFDVSGATSGISDGSCNMRDIAYLIAHFNAPAPVPGTPTNPKWVMSYGANGCVDPYGDRVSNMKDIAAAIQHFNHKQNTGTP